MKLLVLFLAVVGLAICHSVSGQTFQYSKGWTVGKRGAIGGDYNLLEESEVLNSGQLLSACRDYFLRMHQDQNYNTIVRKRDASLPPTIPLA